MTFFHSIYAVYARCSTILYSTTYSVGADRRVETGEREPSVLRGGCCFRSIFIVVLRRHLQLIDERDQHIAYASAHRLRAVKILAA